MVKIIICLALGLLAFLLPKNTIGQISPISQWEGRLYINDEIKPKVALEIKSDTNIKFHSVQENSFDIEVSNFKVSKQNLSFTIRSLNAEFTGQMKNNRIEGKLKIAGQFFDLELSKVKKFTITKLRRPQEENVGGNYTRKEINVYNPIQKINLSGTLTIPNGVKDFPTLVFISGSGANDRDQLIFGHKTFLVWADLLAKSGIASLRLDDRGTAFSEGKFHTADMYDLAEDVSFAVNSLAELEEINTNKIGLIGHSLGADIATFVNYINPNVKFTVLMSVSAEPFYKNILEQNKMIYKSKVSPEALEINNELLELIFESIFKYANNENAKNYLDENLNKLRPKFNQLTDEEMSVLEIHNEISSKDFSYFFSPKWRVDLLFDPSIWISKTHKPMLAVNGSLDTQVAAYNLDLIQSISKDKTNIEVKLFDKKNHLFQNAIVGLPDEYSKIEETISPDVIAEIVNWIYNLNL